MNLEQIRKEIREVETSWKKLFSIKEQFNEHLDRWRDADLYDMHDFNQFVPAGEMIENNLLMNQLGKADFDQAIVYQKEHGWNFIKFDSRIKLAKELEKQLAEKYEVEGWKTETMYLPQKDTSHWRRNDKVQIVDVKENDISDALKEIERKNYGKNTGEDFTIRKMEHYIEKARENSAFHYFGAFMDGTIVGAAYAYVKDGYIQFDNLIVNEEVRKQYVATTLMAYIAEHFDGTIFLHADPDDTPKDMYSKMGFEVIDSYYEYSAMWNM